MTPPRRNGLAGGALVHGIDGRLVGNAGAVGMVGQCAQSASESTTDLDALVATAADAIRETIFAGRSRTTTTQRSEYVRQLAKDLAPDRVGTRCVEQVAALVADLADRGALEDAKEVGRRLIELARLVEALPRPHQDGSTVPATRVGVGESLRDVHLHEKQALAKVEEAELAMVYEPNLATEERYLATSTRERRWRHRLDCMVRRLTITVRRPS